MLVPCERWVWLLEEYDSHNNNDNNNGTLAAVDIPRGGSSCPLFSGRIEIRFFSGGGKTRGPEKKLSGQGREPATNSTHMRRQVREPNPSHSGGRRALSPLPTPTSHNLTTLILSILSWKNPLQKQKSTFWIDHQEKWSSKQRCCALAEPKRNKRLTFVPGWLTELCFSNSY